MVLNLGTFDVAEDEDPQPEYISGPFGIKPEEAAFLRGIFTQAGAQAAVFNGSQTALEDLIELLAPAEDFMRACHQGGMVSDTLERQYTALAGLPPEQPRMISDYLSIAETVFLNTVLAAENADETVEIYSQGGAYVEDSPFCLIRTDPGNAPETGSGTGFKEPKFDNRLQQLLLLLGENGLHADDLMITRGQIPPGAMRQKPYVLVTIPRRDLEIAICDQVGETTFVSFGMLGPHIWASYTKDELKTMPHIRTVRMDPGWEAELLRLLQSPDAPPHKPKVNVSAEGDRRCKWPLTEDFIAHHMWLYFQKHGKFPSENSGPVDGLPGENWSAFNHALAQGFRSLPDRSSLHQIAIKKGWCLGDLTEDIIAHHMWRHFQKHGRFPAQRSGAVDGLPGENWRAFNQGLVQGVRSLPGGSSLHQLAIKKGWCLGDLTEDIIAHHMWRHFQKHGTFPSSISGPIDGLPGETWCAFNRALMGGFRSLPGGSSLAQFKKSEFFQDYIRARKAEAQTETAIAPPQP
jgi:hypothetical protein